jgi:hypothetical protein
MSFRSKATVRRRSSVLRHTSVDTSTKIRVEPGMDRGLSGDIHPSRCARGALVRASARSRRLRSEQVVGSSPTGGSLRPQISVMKWGFLLFASCGVESIVGKGHIERLPSDRAFRLSSLPFGFQA